MRNSRVTDKLFLELLVKREVGENFHVWEMNSVTVWGMGTSALIEDIK